MAKVNREYLNKMVNEQDANRRALPAPSASYGRSVAPEQKDPDCVPSKGSVVSVPDDTLTGKISDKWKRIFAESLKQNEERLAAARSSWPKPKFHNVAWAHKPLGEPKKRKNISKKKAAHE
jgi:hypothetical protein